MFGTSPDYRTPEIILVLSMACVLFLVAETAQAQRKKKFTTSRDVEIIANKSSNISLTADNATNIKINAPKAMVTVNQPHSGPITELWFKANGQLFSNAPETIYPGENLVAKVALDELFWHSRTHSTLASWVSTLENLKKYQEANDFINYNITEVNGLDQLKEEIAYKINQLITNSDYLSPELEGYYKAKLKALGIKTNVAPGADQLTPDLETLFKPEFTIEYFYYNEKKVRINENGSVFCAADKKALSFAPCETDKIIGMYTSTQITVPPNCHEIHYELRLANNLNKVMVSWANKMVAKFPDTYVDITKDVLKKLSPEYINNLDLLVADVMKLSKNPLDPSITTAEINQGLQFVKNGLAFTNEVKVKLNKDEMKNWVLPWLWLTIGLPKVNPFEPNVLIATGSAGKVSPQDKALYQIFEKMVTNGTIEISELKSLDSEFKNIPKIKAALDAEAAQSPNEPQQQDRLLYQGLLKPTLGQEKIYMRHIDMANNYAIMGAKPVKEITENDRMYILAENKPVTQKLISSFEAVAIGPEDSRLTEILEQTNTANDEFNENTSNFVSKEPKEQTRLDNVKILIPLAAELLKQIAILKTLSHLPTLPLMYEQDKTPDLVTHNVVHDYLYQAPVTAKYSIKQVNADNTEKDLVNGTYRINKLYRFRLKAGLVYSLLRKTDYTETASNNYTVDNSHFGIDGTFGVQAFFRAQDIRSDIAGWRPFIYAGLSMKKISENFYVGVGFEPYSGITIGINGHIGKREAIVGNSNTAATIRGTWDFGLAPTILVDPSLFVRLFTFNSTNSSLLNF